MGLALFKDKRTTEESKQAARVQPTCNSTASQPEACVDTQILANSNSQVQTNNIQVIYKR